jgi:hypothetical protein
MHQAITFELIMLRMQMPLLQAVALVVALAAPVLRRQIALGAQISAGGDRQAVALVVALAAPVLRR